MEHLQEPCSEQGLGGSNVNLPEPSTSVVEPSTSTTETHKSQFVSEKPSRQDVRGMHGYTNTLVSSGVTLAVCLLPRLILRARRRRSKRAAVKAPHVDGTVTPSAALPGTESPVLKPFGSPCSTHAPATPTAHRKPQENRQADADSGSDAAPSRSSDQGLHASPQSKQESAEALKQQLKLLLQMQEENTKLRAFMEQHLSSSQKAVALEAENQALKTAKQALEAELEALRRPTFVLNSGEELEKFKRGLPNGGAYAAPTHAHSVCSDANGLAGAPSVDGAPSMAATDMPAGRAAKQVGVMSDFVKWMRSSSSTSGPRQGAAPPRPPVPSVSRAESMRSEKAVPSTPRQCGIKPSGSNADVTQLLESWSSGVAPQMVL